MLFRILLLLFFISTPVFADNWSQYGNSNTFLNKSTYLFDKKTKIAHVTLKQVASQDFPLGLKDGKTVSATITRMEYYCDKQKFCLVSSEVFDNNNQIIFKQDKIDEKLCIDLNESDIGREDFAHFCAPYLSGM